ncbi:MAG: glycosyltransferase, partial [Acidobacteriota bacterium]|nr:glycosyltransferase [Acidobacteriota bacterium]
KGDEELLELNGRKAWHFPQSEEGWYAGHYPANSAEAIAHLETLREKGGNFLLFPKSSFWWLEYYTEFYEYLNTKHERIWSDDCCLIFQLSSQSKR